MYFVIVAMIIGALFGAWRAKTANGSRLDIAQYAGVTAIIFGVLALFVVIVLLRTA